MSKLNSPLTPREWEVMVLSCSLLTPQDIGAQLGIAGRTVDFHLGSIYQKLQVRSRHGLLVYVLTKGWVTFPAVRKDSDSSRRAG